MEPPWRPVRRFVVRLLVVCAVPVALVSMLALWKSYDVADLGVALAVADVIVTLVGLLPFLMLPGSFQRVSTW